MPFVGDCPTGSQEQAGPKWPATERQRDAKSMKSRGWFFLAVAVVWIQSTNARADDLFRLFWRGTYYATNSTGHIVAVGVSEQDFVNQVAQNNGLDASQLVFVYRPGKRDAAVVRNNGAFVAQVFQMQVTFTDVNNPSGSVTVRHALVFDQTHQTAAGSFFGLELRNLNSSGGLVNDNLVGTVLYSNPDLNAVYGVQVSTGSRIVDTTNAP